MTGEIYALGICTWLDPIALQLCTRNEGASSYRRVRLSQRGHQVPLHQPNLG